MNRTGARAQVRRDVASGWRGRGQATQEAQGACVRCDQIQGAQGAGNVEATSLASGRNADVSDARYFFADEGRGKRDNGRYGRVIVAVRMAEEEVVKGRSRV